MLLFLLAQIMKAKYIFRNELFFFFFVVVVVGFFVFFLFVFFCIMGVFSWKLFCTLGPDEDGLQQMLVTITPVYHGEPSTSGQSSENKENELLQIKPKEVRLCSARSVSSFQFGFFKLKQTCWFLLFCVGPKVVENCQNGSSPEPSCTKIRG